MATLTPGGQDCQKQVALGEGPAASPGGRGKCYFCLLLSSDTGCPGRGGQRRPLRLGPAHREFSKDARGCREDGRRGRGGRLGPQIHHQKKGGGWPRGRGRRTLQCLATQQPREEDPGKGPAQVPGSPVDRQRGPGAMLLPPAWLGGSEVPRVQAGWLALLQDRGHIVPTRGFTEDKQQPAPGCFPLGGAWGPTPAALQPRFLE